MVSVVMLVLSRPHSEYILAVFAGKTVSVFIPQKCLPHLPWQLGAFLFVACHPMQSKQGWHFSGSTFDNLANKLRQCENIIGKSMETLISAESHTLDIYSHLVREGATMTLFFRERLCFYCMKMLWKVNKSFTVKENS